MDNDQQEAFRDAVERKKAAAKEASEHPEQSPRQGPGVTLDATGRAQPGIATDDRTPDDASPRQKSTAHRKVTADKWNQ
jgi:hypothetical protein